MKVKELTLEHLHKRITVTTKDWTINGALRYLSVEPGDEYTQRDPSGNVLLHYFELTEVEIAVGPFRASGLTGEEEVQVEE